MEDRTVENLAIPDPLATNRGVSSKVSASIDWISITFKDSKNLSYPQELTRKNVPCKPLNGYNLATRYSDGRIELTHTTRPEMGTHVISSGTSLRAMSISPEMYLKFVMMHGSYLTRLDIAVDCFNCGLRPQDATREIENGHIKTLARQFPLWHDAKSPGYTQYIGKKSSSAFCRIYDKAVEMGNIGDYTRVECSFGGTRAMDAGKKLLQGADYRALVRGFVDFGMWREWKEIMSVTAVPTKYVRTISKTQRWLLAAAAPSLARELYLAGDDDFYFRFIDTVRFHLDKLRQEIETDEEKQGEIA